jgi:FAD/FMN-containing dehydrogenase
VNFARDGNHLLAVRSGGHSAAGHGTCDGGVVIDLSPMKGVRVDTKRQVAWAQTGALWGELDRETQAHGLATVGGTVSDTGIGGLTLGGGLGWLMSLHGLTCDNVVSAEVVTASGKTLRATKNENADLFWALRGGGGNFGVVTAFEYQLHPVSTALAGLLVHPVTSARDVLRFYRDFVATCPDELVAFAGIMTSPDGMPILALPVAYFGDVAQGQRAIEPLRKFGPPVADTIGIMPYTQLQTTFDPALPPGIGRYWKSAFIKKLSDGFIDTFIKAAIPLPSPRSVAILFHVHGAAARRKPEATAYSHRGAMWDLDFIAQWTDEEKAQSASLTEWVRRGFDSMQPYAADVYVNHLGPDDGDRVKSAYGANFDRLAQIKAIYDPGNLFKVNHNIKPQR